MRLPLIATAAAAAFAVPLAMAAAGPRMSGDEFVQAVRCAAYESAAAPSAHAAERARLNIEAQRQPAEAVLRAHNEVNSVNAEVRAVANHGDAAMMAAERSAACSPAYAASAAGDRDAA